MFEFRLRVKPLTREDRVHMPIIRKILKKREFRPEVEKALKSGEIRFSLNGGFSGKGFEELHEGIKWILSNNFVGAYRATYSAYVERLSAHDELQNYGKVGKGALVGIAAGTAAGVVIDGGTTYYDYHGVWGEIAAR
ncbi:hypothetical protein HYT84_01190, partial [Candidatus Micrarchaeota archaeon]|nr:hypothetical protein [Candidatus Micrarchaeota archaeon]